MTLVPISMRPSSSEGDVASTVSPRSWVERLNAAINDGHEAIVAELLAEHVKDPSLGDVNAHCDLGDTVGFSGSALLVAMRRKDQGVFKRLLKHPGIDLERRSDKGWPLLFHAVMRQAEFVDMLLEAGANPHTITTMHNGEAWNLSQMTVHCALHKGAVLDVLAHHKILPTSKEERGQLLMEAVGGLTANFEDGAVVWLLDHGASLNENNKHGASLAELAANIRDKAPRTFVRIEQALLLEQATSLDVQPSTPRSRL